MIPRAQAVPIEKRKYRQWVKSKLDEDLDPFIKSMICTTWVLYKQDKIDIGWEDDVPHWMSPRAGDNE